MCTGHRTLTILALAAVLASASTAGAGARVLAPGHEAELAALVGPEPLDGGWATRSIEVRGDSVRVTLARGGRTVAFDLVRPGAGGPARSAHFAIVVADAGGLSDEENGALLDAFAARVRERDRDDPWSDAAPPAPAPDGPAPPDLGRVTPAAWIAVIALTLAMAGLVLARRSSARGRAWLFDDGPAPADPRPSAAEWVAVGALAILVFAALAGPSLWALSGFGLRTPDLGLYAHAFHHAAAGNGLYDSFEGMDHLGSHASPILWLAVPVWMAWPSVPAVLVVSAASLALAVFPAWLLARRRFGPMPAFLAAAAFAAQPGMHALAAELHEVCLAVAPLCWVMLSVERRRAWPLLVSLAAALACKEDVGLVAAFLGLQLALDRRTRFAGAFVALVGVWWLVVGVGVIIPAHHGDHGHTMARFALFGEGWAGLLTSPFARPAAFWGTLLSADTARYLVLVLSPLAFVPLLAPRRLLPAVPVLLANVLVADEVVRSATSHHVALLLPMLYAAFLAGIDVPGRELGRAGWPRAARASGVVVTVLVALALAITGWPTASLLRPVERGLRPAGVAATRDAIAAVPAGASVTAPEHVAPFFADRDVSRTYGGADDVAAARPETDFLVVERGGSTPPSLPGYEVMHANDSWWVMRRVRR